jgi:hypothetical protein
MDLFVVLPVPEAMLGEELSQFLRIFREALSAAIHHVPSAGIGFEIEREGIAAGVERWGGRFLRELLLDPGALWPWRRKSGLELVE